MYVYVCIYVCMYVCIMSRDSLTFLILNTRLDYLEDLKVKKKKKSCFWSMIIFVFSSYFFIYYFVKGIMIF